MNIPIDTLAILDEFERRDAIELQSQYGHYDSVGIRQGGLIAFVRYFWSVLEPDAPFVDGWPLWAMCEHLEAVTKGDIIRLLINVPPGFMKSMLTNIFWPAWEWGAMGHSSYRYVCFSYSASLTERDNDKFRVLVASDRYQALYGPVRVEKESAVTLDNKTITKVKNVRTGWKLASSVGGVGTGERGDRVIIDDPHNVVESESEIVRGETIRWFRESVSSRLNNLDTGAIVVIGQRVHQYDVSGIIQSPDFDYEHLMIPWEFDRGRVIDNYGNPFTTSIGWFDPRMDEGEGDDQPAWVDRFSEKAMDRTRLEIGPYAWAAQYQQSPAPRGGGLFKRHWWKPWESVDGRYPLFSYVIASLDVAVTEKAENNPSGFTVWGIFQPDDSDNPAIMLIDAWRQRLNMHGDPSPRIISEIPQIGDDKQTVINRNVAWKRRTSEGWGLVEWVAYTCRIRYVDLLLIECEKGGIVAAQEMQRLYGGENWSVNLQPVKGDKHARAMAVVPTFSQGKVYAPLKDWAEMVIDEMEAFPKHRYDDLCLAAGTLIYTRRGKVPIERVKVGDRVITPYGWKKVLATHSMGVKPVGTVAGLTGTGNHPIFTLDSGLVRMDSITQASQVMRFTLCDLMQTIRQTKLNSTAFGIDGWAGVGAIIYRNPRQSTAKEQKGCTLQFGNSILARCLPATKFIIETGIHSIAALKILSVYRVMCIGACLKGLIERSAASFWRQLDRWRLHGMDQRLDWLGIGSMSRIACGSWGISEFSGLKVHERVLGAELNLNGEPPERLSVHRSVNGNSARTGEGKISSFIHSMPVFDLTIEDAHCYYANGVLVHNTDSTTQAIRYFRDAGLARTDEEIQAEVHERVRHKPQPRPLYPV